ncbi:hypothetical protein [Legionella moravica]|uniref:Uncharacterized protein n=1 Tax=Legionella moravica TaxID=39962 RepID=A0A378K4C9_9GAMM|nr:hypothetical protein [Legionella moravica]STX62721.1 Uncharacterised protein [Legionella moravica]
MTKIKEQIAYKSIAELNPEIEEAICKSTFKRNSLGIEILQALN